MMRIEPSPDGETSGTHRLPALRGRALSSRPQSWVFSAGFCSFGNIEISQFLTNSEEMSASMSAAKAERGQFYVLLPPARRVLMSDAACPRQAPARGGNA